MTKKLDNIIETYTDWRMPREWMKAGAGEDVQYDEWCEREVARRTAGGQPCQVVTNNYGAIAVAPLEFEGGV